MDLPSYVRRADKSPPPSEPTGGALSGAEHDHNLDETERVFEEILEEFVKKDAAFDVESFITSLSAGHWFIVGNPAFDPEEAVGPGNYPFQLIAWDDLQALLEVGGGGSAGDPVTITHDGEDDDPVVGDTLTAEFAAGWDGPVQWTRNGTPIGGATAATHITGGGDEGATVGAIVGDPDGLHFTAAGLVVGSGPATVPAAFGSGDWTATAIAGGISFNLTALPSNGGSPITALQYRRNSESAVTLSGTGTGVRNVTGITVASADFQVRAVNAVGNGAWSDVKTRTPDAEPSGSPTRVGDPALTTGNLNLGAGVTAAKPAGTVSTDLLHLEFDMPEAKYDALVVPPGWTLIEDIFGDVASGAGLVSFWAAGDVASTFFVLGEDRNVTNTRMVMTRISGANLATPIRASASSAAIGFDPTVNWTSPAVTAGAGDLILASYRQPQNTTAVGVPTSGYTRFYDNDGGGAMGRRSILVREGVSAGSTGAISHAASGGYESRVTTTVAIRG